MNSRDRVIAAIEGRAVDQLPTGFWHHFDPNTFNDLDATVKNHVHFHQESGVDILKVMNENLFPHTETIKKAKDWLKIKAYGKDAEFIRKQAEITKRVVDAIDGKAYTVLTVFGTFGSTWHSRGGDQDYKEGSELLIRTMREDPKALNHAFEQVSETLMALIDSVKDSGLDGIYYSALAGERHLLTDDEHREWVRPWDEKIINYANDAFKHNILHICRTDLNLERFAGIKASVVNWGSYAEKTPSMKEGWKHFPDAAILGGFDNTKGLLFDGSVADFKDHILKIREEIGSRKVLLGADCTLQGEIVLKQLKKVKEASAAIGAG